MEFESTVQSISWFRDQYLDNSLDIRPPYQRKPVWAARQMCSLIETILLGLPVPEIFIQRTTTPEGVTTYAIVDGQQRIRTVLQYIGAELDPEEQEHNKFPLDKLDADSRWRNLTFAELPDDVKAKFWDYSFSVRYLFTNIDNDVRDMFRRLNKFLTPLKPQELRNAIYIGPFISLAMKLADDEYWAENRIVTASSIRRMGDIEFISELIIGVMHGPQGGSQKIIDGYYEQYEDFEYQFPGQRKTRNLYLNTLEAIQYIFPDIKTMRWGNKTDFYTIFVSIASLLRSGKLYKRRKTEIRQSIAKLELEVDNRLSNEKAEVSKEAVDYVRNVQKGANDKHRRGNRHQIMLETLGKFFSPHG